MWSIFHAALYPIPEYFTHPIIPHSKPILLDMVLFSSSGQFVNLNYSFYRALPSIPASLNFRNSYSGNKLKYFACIDAKLFYRVVFAILVQIKRHIRDTHETRWFYGC